MSRPKRQSTKSVPLKYQVQAIQQIATKKFNVEIKLETGTCEVDLGDWKDVSINTSGKVTFEKKDIERRKKGFLVLVFLKDKETFDPIEQLPVIALSEVEGQHLVVLVSKTGNILKDNAVYYKQFFADLSKGGNCTVRAMEVSLQSLETGLIGKVEKVEELKTNLLGLLKKIENSQHQTRVLQSKITHCERNNRRDEVPALQIKLEALKDELKLMLEQSEELQKIVDEEDAPDLISSDESDAEEYEEELSKATRSKKQKTTKLKLGIEDFKAGPAEILVSSEEDDDEEDEDFEEEENHDDVDSVISPIDVTDTRCVLNYD